MEKGNSAKGLFVKSYLGTIPAVASRENDFFSESSLLVDGEGKSLSKSQNAELERVDGSRMFYPFQSGKENNFSSKQYISPNHKSDDEHMMNDGADPSRVHAQNQTKRNKKWSFGGFFKIMSKKDDSSDECDGISKKPRTVSEKTKGKIKSRRTSNGFDVILFHTKDRPFVHESKFSGRKDFELSEPWKSDGISSTRFIRRRNCAYPIGESPEEEGSSVLPISGFCRKNVARSRSSGGSESSEGRKVRKEVMARAEAKRCFMSDDSSSEECESLNPSRQSGGTMEGRRWRRHKFMASKGENLAGERFPSDPGIAKSILDRNPHRFSHGRSISTVCHLDSNGEDALKTILTNNHSRNGCLWQVQSRNHANAEEKSNSTGAFQQFDRPLLHVRNRRPLLAILPEVAVCGSVGNGNSILESKYGSDVFRSSLDRKDVSEYIHGSNALANNYFLFGEEKKKSLSYDEGIHEFQKRRYLIHDETQSLTRAPYAFANEDLENSKKHLRHAIHRTTSEMRPPENYGTLTKKHSNVNETAENEMHHPVFFSSTQVGDFPKFQNLKMQSSVNDGIFLGSSNETTLTGTYSCQRVTDDGSHNAPRSDGKTTSDLSLQPFNGIDDLQVVNKETLPNQVLTVSNAFEFPAFARKQRANETESSVKSFVKHYSHDNIRDMNGNDVFSAEGTSSSILRYYADQNPRSRNPIHITCDPTYAAESRSTNYTSLATNNPNNLEKNRSRVSKNPDEKNNLKNVANPRKNNNDNSEKLLCVNHRLTNESKPKNLNPEFAMESSVYSKENGINDACDGLNAFKLNKSNFLRKKEGGAFENMNEFPGLHSGREALKRLRDLEAVDKSEKENLLKMEADMAKSNLDDALNELEVIYNSLKLKDEDLGNRIDHCRDFSVFRNSPKNVEPKNSVPSVSVFGQNFTNVKNYAENRDSGFKDPENASVGSGIATHEKDRLLGKPAVPDKISDDMAFRRMNTKERNDVKKFPLQSYLRSSPALSSFLREGTVSPRESPLGEPDITHDDVVFRSIRHANSTLKIRDPQPPFGIPIGIISSASDSDYLHAIPRERFRATFSSSKTPDIVKDDLAFRNLRKDDKKYGRTDFLQKRAMRSLSINICDAENFVEHSPPSFSSRKNTASTLKSRSLTNLRAPSWEGKRTASKEPGSFYKDVGPTGSASGKHPYRTHEPHSRHLKNGGGRQDILETASNSTEAGKNFEKNYLSFPVVKLSKYPAAAPTSESSYNPFKEPSAYTSIDEEQLESVLSSLARLQANATGEASDRQSEKRGKNAMTTSAKSSRTRGAISNLINFNEVSDSRMCHPRGSPEILHPENEKCKAPERNAKMLAFRRVEASNLGLCEIQQSCRHASAGGFSPTEESTDVDRISEKKVPAGATNGPETNLGDSGGADDFQKAESLNETFHLFNECESSSLVRPFSRNDDSGEKVPPKKRKEMPKKRNEEGMMSMEGTSEDGIRHGDHGFPLPCAGVTGRGRERTKGRRTGRRSDEDRDQGETEKPGPESHVWLACSYALAFAFYLQEIDLVTALGLVFAVTSIVAILIL